MTDQYQRTNVNFPRKTRRVTGVAAVQLDLDDDLVIVDSSLGPVTVTLPEARQIPSWDICIKGLTAGVFPVNIIGLGGQTIDGAATLVLNNNNEAANLHCTGLNWVTCGGLGIGAAGPTGPTGPTGATGPAGATGGGGCLTNFLVSPNPAGAPYQLISTAYNAAKLAGYGTGQPNGPTKILVCPGTYTDAVLMDTPGIDVIAIDQDSQTAKTIGAPGDGHTVLNGTLAIVLASAGTLQNTSARWQGIDIRPASGAAVLFAGTDLAYFYLTDCQVVSTDSQAIADSNSGSGFIESSVLDVQRCSVRSANPGSQAIAVNSAGLEKTRLYFTHCLIATPGQAIASDNGYVFLESCYISGLNCALLSASILDCYDTYFNSPDFVVGVDEDSIFEIYDCEFDTPSSPFIVGDGIFNHDAMAFERSSVRPWATTLAVSTQEGIPQESNIFPIILGAGYEITSETNISAIAIGPGTLTLPLTSERPGVLRLKENQASIGPITLTAQGADLIRVGGAAPVASVTLDANGLFLVADPANNVWEAWATGGTTCLNYALVSPNASLAPFQSIQSAYDFLFAQGAGALSPAKVLVCPGVYTENVTMYEPGIDIVAIAPDDFNELRQYGYGITRLNGTLTINLTGGAPDPYRRTCAWRGIDIFAFFGPAVNFTGTNFQLAYITDCQLNCGGIAVVLDNTGVSLGDSTLDIIRSKLHNTSTNGSGPPFNCADGILLLNDCVCLGSHALIAADALVSAQDTRFLVGVQVSGEFNALDSTIGEIIFAGDVGFVELTRCDMSAVPAATGAGGTFIYDSFPMGSAWPPIAFPAVLTVQQKASLPQGAAMTYYSGAGPHLLSGSEVNIMVDPPVGATASVQLPPALAQRGPIRIKQDPTNSTGVTSLTTTGGETINRAAPPIIVPIAGITLVSHWSPPYGPPDDWETYS